METCTLEKHTAQEHRNLGIDTSLMPAIFLPALTVQSHQGKKYNVWGLYRKIIRFLAMTRTILKKRKPQKLHINVGTQLQALILAPKPGTLDLI